MKLKNTIGVICLTIISANSFAQENQTEDQMKIISMVSENKLGTDIVAHTYRLNMGSPSNVKDSDNDEAGRQLPAVENIISTMLSVEGVSRCTFDQATQTFTILSGPDSDLTEAVKEINEI